MGYPKKDYTFIKFEKSKAKNKKYVAFIKNKKTEKIIKINFGDNRYEHYKDTTGLKIYTNKDHNDKERRDKYKKRHIVYLDKNEYSPAYFSWFYLW